MSGPLTGVKVVEFAGIGPGPFSCMMLADMGAEVLRIDRAVNVGKEGKAEPKYNNLLRGRKNVAIDLKNPDGVELALQLCEKADILIEGFRPGVMERLGLGPDVVLKRNPKLVYGRMTGWGQDGPIAHTAGHDINYISLSGALHSIGPVDGPPVPPLNLVGDFGGGALYMVVGALAAYVEAQKSGKGQVVDTSMVEGSASLMSAMYGALASGAWEEQRGHNRLDGGAHYYGPYECKDGKYVSIGSIEPQFYALLLEKTGLKGKAIPDQLDRSSWAVNRATLKEIFKTKTRAEWAAIMEDSDVCFGQVLSMSEAMEHPHNVARGSFIELDGVKQPGPAPKFSRTPSKTPMGVAYAGQHSKEGLADWGFAAAEIDRLAGAGAIKQR
ncbi:MAG: CoA transferase [Alphaproteobacteria bacterium]|nr:CoA transferase [Alphaproteobacteria bacterium]MCB9930264.1 CoA transferase [Alphaproteobacteria bacterium]